jgi:eukaryotic-like serine/threonine-protein kinase
MPTESNEKWQHLSRLLDQVLDLEEPERARWLELLAENDPEMAEQVSAALAAREREGFTGFLAGSAIELKGIGESTLVGRQVGPYVIDAEIGRGGMGSVWRAHRTDGLYEGIVAIKFVHPAWIGSMGEQRFRVEGSLLGRLDHPNIARLIDAGVLAGTQPYLILEYIEGEPIDAYCDREKLDLEARVNLFLGVLAAVAHAHSHLIVHRDIKPSNIFVTSSGTVKLLDFGIAKLLQGEGEAALTQSSAVPLTPQYAAPEQLLGKPVTTATDVYSLGLVLYVLLTGSHPIPSGTRSSADFMRAVLTEEPARASTATIVPTIRRRALEGDLDNILRKALKKDPRERYASVGAFADDLKRFLTHEPVQARADTIPYRVSKFVRRHRGGVLSALLVAIGLMGTSAVALWQLYQANVERDISKGETRRARGLSELNSFMLTESTASAPPQEIRSRLDHAVEFVERNFQGEQDVMASLLFALSANYIDIGEAEFAAKSTAKGEAIVDRLNNDPYMQTEVGCRRARDFALAHHLPEARARLAKALEQMRHLHVVQPGLRVLCGTSGALIAQADGDYANAILDLRSVLHSLEQEQAHGSNSWVAAQNDLARTLYMAGDFRGGWEADGANLKVAKERALTDSGRYFAMASIGCHSLRSGGQPQRSRNFVDSILADVRRDVPGAELPFFLTGCRALAELAMELPNSSVAALASASHAAQSAGMVSMASVFSAAMVREAIKCGDLAIADAGWAELAPAEEKMLKDNEHGAEIVRLLLLHADLDMAHGQFAQAARRIDQGAALIAARSQPTNSDARDVEILRTRLAFATHEFQQTLKHAQAALELSKAGAIDPQSSAWIGEALLWRARAEAASGDRLKAKATAQEAVPHLEKNMDTASATLAAARELAST